jgi:hypothetical protein
VFIHKDDRMEVAQGRFVKEEGDRDLTRLESGMSFLQVRASMPMKEKLRQVRSAICVNRREIAHRRLEAIAGVDNPYSLIAIFGPGPESEETEEQNLEDLRRKYLWWLNGRGGNEATASAGKANTEDTVILFEGKNTRV